MRSRNVILHNKSFLNVRRVLLVLGEDVSSLQCYKKQMPLLHPHKNYSHISPFTPYPSLSVSLISYLPLLCLWMLKLDSKGQGKYVNQFCVCSLPPIPSLKL